MINRLDINEYTEDAKAIAWDTCHKIYILMDDEQVAIMREYGYDPIITADQMTAEEMTSTLIDWYDQSCPLRFINAVETTPKPNDGFINVVPQFADEEDYQDED